jgi:hypothetical protein
MLNASRPELSLLPEDHVLCQRVATAHWTRLLAIAAIAIGFSTTLPAQTSRSAGPGFDQPASASTQSEQVPVRDYPLYVTPDGEIRLMPIY